MGFEPATRHALYWRLNQLSQSGINAKADLSLSSTIHNALAKYAIEESTQSHFFHYYIYITGDHFGVRHGRTQNTA